MGAYMESLREAIIEGYIGVVFGVKESRDTTLLDPYVSGIFDYICALCTSGFTTSMGLLKGLADLMGDLALLYGRNTQGLLGKPFVPHIIQALDTSSIRTHKEAAIRLQTALTQVFT